MALDQVSLDPPAPGKLKESFEERLSAVIGRLLPGSLLPVRSNRLTGGASQETWAIEVVAPRAVERLVLRRAPGGGTGEPRQFAAGLKAEAQLLTLVRQHSVPAPEILYVLVPEDGLGKGYLMRHVAGETIARKILRDSRFDAVRPRLAARCGEVLARIHSIPTVACPALPSNTAVTRLAALYKQYRHLDLPRPVFELAFQWLRAHVLPDPEKLRLVHGDFRNGNLIIDETDLQAVLDWELAHLGDPIEDLGWFCVPSWRFGEIDKEAGGFGRMDEFIAAYEEVSGMNVNRASLLYWMVFGVLFWGISCLQFAIDFRRGDRTVERAAIGRRASETEIDLLTLIAPWG